MTPRSVLPALALCALLAPAARAQETAETEACKSTALIALKERSPSITDVVLDLDSLSISKADTKVEDTPIRTVIMGDAYLERGRTGKPHQFLCLIGDKGKVLMTFFTQR